MCKSCLDNWIPAPPKAACPFCGQKGSDWTCRACREDRYLDGLTAFGSYGNPLYRELLSSWKYQGDLSVEDILKCGLRKALPALSVPVPVSCVSFVPLHLSRKRFRGFDQSFCVAQWIGELKQLPVETLAQRTRKTAPRARTKQEQRHVGEMDHVFGLLKDTDLPQTVLLCDDVFTSGSTMDAMARLLKEHGVKTVWGFVLAKGG